MRTQLLYLALLLSSTARAGLIPVLDITGGGAATVPLANAVGGWEFHASQPVTIAALGLWDERGAPLSIAHEVGLWTAGGAQLATATVDNTSLPVASASPNGRWLFTAISPLTLTPGDYVLGAVWGNPIQGADGFRFGETPQTLFGVTYDQSRAATQLSSLALVFPSQGSAGGGWFGPNMAVTVYPAPEPGGAGLLGYSGAILVGFRCLRGRLRGAQP